MITRPLVRSAFYTSTTAHRVEVVALPWKHQHPRSGNTVQWSRMTAVAKATDDQKLEILTKHEVFIFDLDGTIWKGSNLIQGAKELLEVLRAQSKKVYFVTNNATKSREGYVKKFEGLGLKAAKEEIYGSAFAAAAYLKNKQFKKKAYVIGEEGVVQELQGTGITCLGGPADKDKAVDFSNGDPVLQVDPDVGAVVVGLDRNINYYKIQYALTCLLENGAMFIATNTDSRGNFSMKQEWAGAGTMVGALIGASEAEPVVVGKPSSFMLESIVRESAVKKEQICIIGDRLDTDILWGTRSGCSTVLVLTGITSEEMLLSPDNRIKPNYVLDSVADLLSVKDKLPSSCVIS